jgi:hypothetical protein
MKRDRRSEGEAMLVGLERTLRLSLLEVLPSVVKFGSPLFTNSKFNPHGLPAHILDEGAEAFFESASACVDLREHLGLSVVGSVGHLFLDACEESASSNEHRRGPRKLAEALLERLNTDP